MLRTTKNSRNTSGCYLNIAHDLKLALLIVLCLLRTDLAQANTDYIQEIESQVRTAALVDLAAENSDTEVDLFINPINPSLSLARCTTPLDIRFPYKSNQRLTARVSCGGSKPWSIFVTARVRLWKQVVVAARPITRGTQLTPNILTLSRVDTTNRGADYFTEIGQVSGQKAKRSIGSDQPILMHDLEPALLINRGDKIVLEANRGGVQIRVSAIALEAGSLGEQIKVENLQSKREVYAEVSAAGRATIK